MKRIENAIRSCIKHSLDIAVLFYTKNSTCIYSGAFAIELGPWSLEDVFWGTLRDDDDGETFLDALGLWSISRHGIIPAFGKRSRKDIEKSFSGVLDTPGTDINRSIRSRGVFRSEEGGNIIIPFKEGWCMVDAEFLSMLKRFGSIQLCLHDENKFFYRASNDFGTVCLSPRSYWTSWDYSPDPEGWPTGLLRFPKPRKIRTRAFGEFDLSPLFVREELDEGIVIDLHLSSNGRFKIPCLS